MRRRSPPAGRSRRGSGRRSRTCSAIVDAPSADDHQETMAQANAAVKALHQGFLATPYRPTGLSTPARAIVRLVDDLSWLNAIAQINAPPGRELTRSGDLRGEGGLGQRHSNEAPTCSRQPGASLDPLRTAVRELRASLDAMERSATEQFPPDRTTPGLGHRRAAGERARLDARSELPRAGAQLRRLADRRQHRADRARRAPQLVGPRPRSPARGDRRGAGRRATTRSRPLRATFGVAAQQPARSRRARTVRRSWPTRPVCSTRSG